MPTLSAREIAGYAKAAGFHGKGLQTAVAVALAESSGRTSVVNSIGCVGLWQIYQSVHVKAHPNWTTAWLKNPANNARAAYVLSNGGTNWHPWETYTNGRYLIYMSRAASAAGEATAEPTSEATGDALTAQNATTYGPSLGITDFVAKVTDPHLWYRVGLFLGGFLMLLIAAGKLTHVTDLAKKAVKVVA